MISFTSESAIFFVGTRRCERTLPNGCLCTAHPRSLLPRRAQSAVTISAALSATGLVILHSAIAIASSVNAVQTMPSADLCLVTACRYLKPTHWRSLCSMRRSEWAYFASRSMARHAGGALLAVGLVDAENVPATLPSEPHAKGGTCAAPGLRPSLPGSPALDPPCAARPRLETASFAQCNRTQIRVKPV